MLLCIGLLPGPFLTAWSMYVAVRDAHEPTGIPLAFNLSVYGLPVAAMGSALFLLGIRRSRKKNSN